MSTDQSPSDDRTSGARPDETDAASGGAGSFDSRHGEFTDGQAGAGIDPATGAAVHGDGLPNDDADPADEGEGDLDDQQRHQRSLEG